MAQIFRYKAGKARRVITLPIKAQAVAAVATVPSRCAHGRGLQQCWFSEHGAMPNEPVCVLCGD